MKILMVLSRLAIGGAETHVVELSRALTVAGHTVVLASSGGVYETELSAAGIRHVPLPLDSRHPTSVLRAYRGLRALIKEESFDIVHAHARIPAVLCGLLARRMHFRFVTTAHLDFPVNFLWRCLTNWGEQTLAVSYDLKEYLIRNYGVYPDNIHVTVNGIDMDKFSADTDFSDIAAEFSLGGSPRIVYVSRLDVDRSAPALDLCRALPALCAQYPAAELVIVGGGDDYDRVRQAADEANAALGRRAVVLTGPRTDIRKFIAAADVFVGVSRSALEAMAAAKPVIVAGNQGYLGIFTEDKLPAAISTNFCCRGCGTCSPEVLAEDLSTLFSMSEAALAEMGAYNRSVIAERYSLAKMAEDYLTVYRALTPYAPYRYGDILISGYYGFFNLGDDSILFGMLRNLRRLDPNVKITVLSRKPGKMRNVYGVKCIGRLNFPAIHRAMKHARLLISGGGSLLQDKTSAHSLRYYLAIVRMAQRRGLPVMFYANGIGPVYGEQHVRALQAILPCVDVLSLREPTSIDTLAAYGMPREHMRLSADPSFTLTAGDEGWNNYVSRTLDLQPGKRYFVVSLRVGHSLDPARASLSPSPRLEKELAEACAEIYRRYALIPLFVPMHPAMDRDVCARVLGASGVPGVMLDSISPAEFMGLLSRHARFAIGMRLHTLIYAANVGVPMIGLSYDIKVESLLRYLDVSTWMDVRRVTAEQIVAAADSIMAADIPDAASMAERIAQLRALTAGDAEAAMRIVRGAEENRA